MPTANDASWKPALRGCLPPATPHLAVVVSSLDPAVDISDLTIASNVTKWHQAIERYCAHLHSDATTKTTELEESQESRDRLIAEGNTVVAERDLLRDMIQTMKTSTTALTPRRQTKDPDEFDGKEKDIEKRQREYLVWRSKVTRNIAIDTKVFKTDFERIQYMGSMLAGDAYDLVREILDYIATTPTDPTGWEWKTSTSMFDFLDTQYATQDLDRSAGQRFDLLTMANKPYQNFIAEFEKLAGLAGKTPEQKVSALRLKVSREVLTLITSRPNKPKKNEWMEWRKFCQDIYDDLEEEKHYARLRNRDNRPPVQTLNQAPRPATTIPTPTTTTSTDDVMELDSAGAAARREHRRIHNLCFYCGGQHPVRGYPEKIQNDAKFGRSTDLTRGGAPRGRGNRGGRGSYRGSYTTGTPTPYPAGPAAPQNVAHPQPGNPWATPYPASPAAPQNVAHPQPGNPWATPYYGTPANPYRYPSPAFNRLRSIEPGYVETESVSSGHGHLTPATDASSFVDSPTENE